MDGNFSKLRFSEFTKAATAGAIIGATALVPLTAKAATGSVEISAGNANWFVNTNITFSSTSSQFGMSEASLHTAISTRDDAFDGVLAWHVNATPPGTSSDGGYRSPGGTASVTANSVLGTVQPLAGLNVQGQLWFATSKAVARSILTLQNPTGSDITVTVDNDNNVGSDNATRITATSSGDATYDASDNWIISCQSELSPPACDGPGSGLDPVLTFAIQGPLGAVRGTRLSGFVNGDDNPNMRFTVTVPAGTTRAMMYFVQLSDTPDHALIDAVTFNTPAAMESAGYLANLPGIQESQVVNWNLNAGIPTLSEWAFGGFATLLGLIGLGSLGMFTRRRSVRS
jgi:hypothetical protein